MYADKAHDLEEIRRTVDAAASDSAILWLSYIFTLFYIGIAAGAVTYKDLLLENPVKLPFLGVELPLIAFFSLAPIIFIVLHAYTLVHFVMLAAKVGIFDDELKKQLLEADDTIEDRLRWQLPSNILVEFLAGPKAIRKGRLRLFLKSIAWISLVIGPILLLLLIQAKFLAYHLEWVTWVQRCAVFVDVWLLWLLWPAVLEKRVTIEWRWAQFWRFKWAALFSLVPIWLAFITATFPGERMYLWVGPNTRFAAWLDQIGVPLPHNKLFEGPIKGDFRGRQSPFSATLVVVDELEKDMKPFTEFQHAISLRARHLEGAVLNGSFLRKVDLTGAQLQNASLDSVQLQDATLENANLQGAWLTKAALQGARLDKADLAGARLDDARIQGALLDGAQLQGALLDGAQLQGASLDSAQLQGASLNQSQLQGASLDSAQLQGASLEGSKLQGAELDNAQLQGAKFKDALLNATSLNAAHVWRAQLDLDPKSSSIRQQPELVWDSAPSMKTDYPALKEMITARVPSGERRDAALNQIEILEDPSKPHDETKISTWQKDIKKATAQPKEYAGALAGELKALACSGEADAIHIVRGLARQESERKSALAGAQAAKLVEAIEAIVEPSAAKDCPVSTELTEQERADLRKLAKSASGGH